MPLVEICSHVAFGKIVYHTAPENTVAVRESKYQELSSSLGHIFNKD